MHINKKIVLFALINNTIFFSNKVTTTDDIYTTYYYISSIDSHKEISYYELIESLNSNKKINEEYRNYTKEFIDLVYNKYPNINYAMLNENLKSFYILERDLKDIKKNKPKAQAYYNINYNFICIHNEFQNEDMRKSCYFHELWHMTTSMYKHFKNTVYYYVPLDGIPNSTIFNEGMISFLTNEIYPVGVTSYTNQFDEINLLYEISGSKMIDCYFNDEIDDYLKEYSDLFKLMDEEYNKKSNSIDIYNVILDIYLKSDNCNKINREIFDLIKKTSYNDEIKNEIFNLYSDALNITEIDENCLITFDNEIFYKMSSLFFVNCGEDTFLIDNNILKNYLYNGNIKNIYDNDYISMKEPISKIVYLKEYLKYEKYIINDGVIYLDLNEVKGVSYVKSK